MIRKMQGSIKDNSASFALIASKVFSGMMIGLTFALILKEIAGLGSFGFMFIIVSAVGVFLKMSGKWRFTGVLLFDLFCIMVALMLRMYVYLAPGS